MPSTYTNLGIELIGDGEKANTWGAVTNTNWQMTEEALAGKHIITLSDQDTTIATYSNATAGSGNETRKFFLQFTGTLTANRTITLPSKDKIYGLENKTTGGFDLTFTCGAGDNVQIDNGSSAIVHTAITGGHCVNLTNQGTSSTVSDAIAKIPSSWTNSVQSILGLTDTPSALGTQGQVLKVNSGGTALEFADDDAGSGSGGDAATLQGNDGAYYRNYNNLTNTPTIPTATSQLTNNSGFVTSSGWTSMSSFVGGGGATYGGVGTYIYATVNDTSNYTPGQSSISGSSLRPAGAVRINASGNSGPTAEIGSSGPSGTWRCMGNRVASNTGWTNATYVATLFVRTS